MKNFKEYIDGVLISLFWVILVNLSNKLVPDFASEYIEWGGVIIINVRMLLNLIINDNGRS